MKGKLNFKYFLEKCPEEIMKKLTTWFINLTNDILEAHKWEKDLETDIFDILCKLDLFTFNWNTKDEYYIRTYKARLSDNPFYSISISKIINIFDCSYNFFVYVSYPEKYSYKIFPVPVNKTLPFESSFSDIMIMANYEKFNPDPVLGFELQRYILSFDQIVSTFYKS